MKTLQQFISERNTFIGSIDRKYEIEISMLKSPHAEERQTRHGDDEMSVISDEEIIETVRKASDKIITDIINGNINIDDRFVVRDANTDLNIVCQIHHGRQQNELRVDIVTVIRTDDFYNTKKSWVVMVR